MKILRITLFGLALSALFFACKKEEGSGAPVVKGCMDPTSVNFNAAATEDDGSCSYVSTAPEKRTVVVEEYTGVRCTFCPDGHRRAQYFQDANPGKVILINVHTGSYATPAAGWSDFTNSWGAAMASKAGMGQSGTGYPGGSVSRNTFAGNAAVAPFKMAKGDQYTLLNRGGWWNNNVSPAGDVVKMMDAPANVGVKVKLNEATREISVKVEVFCVKAIVGGFKLNVALLESNIVGKQIDAGKTVTDYVHKHMLRDFLTGQWGEAIDGATATAGAKITKTFTYTIAEKDKNGNAIKLADCTIAAYLSAADNNDILNGKEVKLK